MEISDIRVIKLSKVYKTEDQWKFSGGSVKVWNTCLVQVTTDDGCTGLGEIGDGHFIPDVAEQLTLFMQRMLRGISVFDTNLLFDRLYKAGHFWGRKGLALGVLSGIEMAFWDLQGKMLGVPVYQLLGGAYRTKIRTYASGGMERSDEEFVKELKEHVDFGFDAVKIRGGYADVSHDERLMALARSALGDKIDIAIDAGQGYVPRPWSIKKAVEAVQRLAPYRPLWLEEPIRTDDYNGYAEVRSAASFPIAGGENLSGMPEAKLLIDSASLDIIQADITHAGGIGETRRIADYAMAHGLQWAPHVFRSGIGFMAHFHLCMAQPNAMIFEYSRQAALREELIIEMPHFEAGFLSIVNQPGLGVHLPDSVLSECAYQPNTEQAFLVETYRE